MNCGEVAFVGKFLVELYRGQMWADCLARLGLCQVYPWFISGLRVDDKRTLSELDLVSLSCENLCRFILLDRAKDLVVFCNI